MGRLENIIARNRQPNQLRERVVVSFVFGAIVLLIIVLAVFTDFGLPPEARNAGEAPAGSGSSRSSGSSGNFGGPDHPDRTGHGKRVDGVLLRATPAPRPVH